MKRMSLAAALFVALSAGPGRADTVPQLVGVPAEYTPGTSFTFEVRVPGVADFAGFSVQLVFETAVLDPDLAVTAAPDPTQYPFPSISGFSATPTPPDPGGTVYTLTIADSGPGTFTEPGVNDLLAVVTVNPGLGLTGPITISVGSETALLYNMEGRNDQFPEPVVVEQGVPPGPVPAPPAIVLLGVGALVLAGWTRLNRPTVA
jgi:hypothetical protein